MEKARRGRHEGSIRERKDGRWEGRISLSYDGDGKRIHRSVYGDTKQAVIAAMNELRALPRPTMATSSKATVAEFEPMWRAAMVAEARLRENTLAYYQSHMRTHVLPSSFASMAIGRVRAQNIEGLLAGIPSVRSREGTYEALASMFRLATRRGLVRENPIVAVPKPKAVRKTAKIWVAEEARRVLAAAAETRFHGVYALGLGAGLRRGEIFALRARDIDLDRRTVRIERQLLEVEGKLSFADPRTERSARTVQLPGFVVEALRTRISALSEDPEALLFGDSDGGPMRRSNFDRRVHRDVVERAEVPYRRLHEMRHSQASLLLAAGESVKLVSERLGHADERTTLGVYAHLLPRADEHAAAKIDGILSRGVAQQRTDRDPSVRSVSRARPSRMVRRRVP